MLARKPKSSKNKWRRPINPKKKKSKSNLAHGNAKFDINKIECIIQALRWDSTKEQACAYAMISTTTFDRWLAVNPIIRWEFVKYVDEWDDEAHMLRKTEKKRQEDVTLQDLVWQSLVFTDVEFGKAITDSVVKDGNVDIAVKWKVKRDRRRKDISETTHKWRFVFWWAPSQFAKKPIQVATSSDK